jgi:ABC-2 type transport system permease protein
MRINALVLRILKQFYRDKRTLALMILAPILILTLVHLVFNGEDYEIKIGLIDTPDSIAAAFEKEELKTSIYNSEAAAKTALKDRKIDAYFMVENDQTKLMLEGSDPSITKAAITKAQGALQNLSSQKTVLDVDLLYGSIDMKQFDLFGPNLLGIFAFLFVFLVAGVSFLRERTSGTLERLLSSPIRRWELVLAYIIGFGLFTMVQSGIIVVYSVYVLKMENAGSILYVLFITLLLALVALTLGILLSSFAHNELQMFQFIPIVIVPQVFFSGLFNLDTISPAISWVSYLTPLYYAADALREVMIRGHGFKEIIGSLSILLGYSIIFMIINIFVLKKHRRI